MSTIVTRSGKGSPLTHNEVDANFNNLNTDKIQSGNTVAALTITSATINGGTINGTTVGATTPAAGKFTTLEATGNTDLGTGSANYIDVAGGATTVAPVISAQGSDTNIPLVLQPKGTGALQAQLTTSTATGGNARGINAVDWQTNRSSATFVASGSYSAVGGGASNRATTTFAVASGGNNNTSAGFGSVVVGGNSNISNQPYTFVGAGESNTASSYPSAVVAGSFNVAGGYYNFIGGGFTNSGTANEAVTTQSATMNATTAVTLAATNANIKVGQFITGTNIANNTFVAAISGTALTLSKVASGSSTSTLSFFKPHGVVVGGGNNQATGSYAFIGGGGDAGTAANRNTASGDWSVVAGGNRNVASGNFSFVGSGFTNTASGIGSFIGGGGNFGVQSASGQGAFIGAGWGNTVVGSSGVALGANNQASGEYSSCLGGAYGLARSITGNTVFSASSIPISVFANQAALLILGRQTTDATATALASNPSAAGTTNQVILPNNSAYYFRGEVIAGVTGGGNTKAWVIEGAIKRGVGAATTALVGTPTVTSAFADVGAATWDIAVTADTTNGGLRVTFTGQAATTIRCVAQIRTTEMAF